MQDCYPKWLYHKTRDAVIVNSKEEHDALGKGWQETPYEKPEKQIEKAEKQAASKTEEI